ncbi:TRAP transporter small permease [Pseudotabrizicola formosa]|uniref:TRAP transporter small permease n=1 Tax=Pseudotabrizicola formosa TaxID=2030009 RepID=UPI001FED9FD7|nr:TRAP transporter small permease subunit [Pseudotabrizicola formosa]
MLGGIVFGLDLSARLICALTLTVLFAGLLANVILRYTSGAGLQWAYEMHAILLPWMVAGGLILATIYNRNIAVTILPDLLGPVAGRALLFLVLALTLVISAFVVWSSFPIMRAARFQRIASLGGVSQLWGYASLVYGFVGVAVICACDLITLMMGRTPGRGIAASSLS